MIVSQRYHNLIIRQKDREIDDLKMMLKNTHESLDRYKKELELDYGIYYNANCDWFRKLREGYLG